MFTQNSFGPISSHGNSDMPNIWTYRTLDSSADVNQDDYFIKKISSINAGDFINLNASDGEYTGAFTIDNGVVGVNIYPIIKPLNHKVINELSDLVTAAETRITFKANTKYIFGNTSVIQTDLEADVGTACVIEGLTTNFKSYEYTGTGTAFNSVAANFEFVNFGFAAPNGTLFNLVDPRPFIMRFSRCFECENVGTISGVGTLAALNIFDSVFLNIKTQGIIASGNFLLLAIREILLLTSSTGVNLLDFRGSLLNDMEITNLEAVAPAGSFVLVGDAGSVNMAAGRVANISDSNLSTKLLGNSIGGGLDANDPGYKYESATVTNSKTIGHTYVTTPATTNILDGVAVQVAGTYTQGSETSQASSDSTGIITMHNRIEKRGEAKLDIDISKQTGAAAEYMVTVQKNAGGLGVIVPIDGMATTVTLAGGGSAQVSISAPTSFVDGDKYFATILGMGTDVDVTATTQGFKVVE